jgi:hypothetical protein
MVVLLYILSNIFKDVQIVNKVIEKGVRRKRCSYAHNVMSTDVGKACWREYVSGFVEKAKDREGLCEAGAVDTINSILTTLTDNAMLSEWSRVEMA